MKNLDLFSKRILSLSIGLTMIILSICFLILTLKGITTANAGSIDKEWIDQYKYQKIYNAMSSDTLLNNDDTQETIEAVQVFGIGIREGNLYFGILYSNNSIGLHKAPAEGEDILEW
jgi:hypothetical protein